jgi:hypothetical protein
VDQGSQQKFPLPLQKETALVRPKKHNVYDIQESKRRKAQRNNNFEELWRLC